MTQRNFQVTKRNSGINSVNTGLFRKMRNCCHLCILKTMIKMVQTVTLLGTQVLGLQELTVQPDCLKGRVVYRTLWRHAFKRSPGINRKSRVSYPSLGFLFSATWPLMLKKHYNGLINQSISRIK